MTGQGTEITKSQNLPIYVTGDFDKELNYKLWSTKHSRYIANRRLKLKHRSSTRAISYLSAYLIGFTLFDYLFLSVQESYNPAYFIFGSILLSVFIIIFNQLESSANYTARAAKHYKCALEVTRLYNRLRILKRGKNPVKDDSFWTEVDKIDQEYTEVLGNYENHDQIDYDFFRAKKPKYEDHHFSPLRVGWTYLHWYLVTFFMYHFALVAPIILFYVFIGSAA